MSVVLIVLVEEPQLRPTVSWELLIVQFVLESGFQGLSAAGGFLVRLDALARCDYCRQVPTPGDGTVARLDLTVGGAGVAAIVTNPPQDRVPYKVDQPAEDEKVSVNIHGGDGQGLGKGKKGKDKKRTERRQEKGKGRERKEEGKVR